MQGLDIAILKLSQFRKFSEVEVFNSDIGERNGTRNKSQ